MKTKLNITIKTKNEAVAYLTELHNNNESYHPEDDAHDIRWFDGLHPSTTELDQLNINMEACYAFVDPCAVVVHLSNGGHYIKVNNQWKWITSPDF